MSNESLEKAGDGRKKIKIWKIWGASRKWRQTANKLLDPLFFVSLLCLCFFTRFV